jgi:hypothetical protein
MLSHGPETDTEVFTMCDYFNVRWQLSMRSVSLTNVTAEGIPVPVRQDARPQVVQ